MSNYELSKMQRDLIVRGLAVQALTSPGMRDACRVAADELDGAELFDQFIEYMSDIYEAVER